VKAEDVDGAQQTPQRTDDVDAAVGADARLDRCEIFAKCLGRRVAGGIVGQRETQSAMDEREFAPVWLGFLPRTQRITDVWKRGHIALDRSEQVGRYSAAHDVLREPRLQRRHGLLIARDDESARLLVCVDNRVGSHVGVPVAIRADPTAERQKRRHRPAGASFETFEEQGCFVEERLTKTREQVTDFVVHRRCAVVEFAALPHEHDLRAQLGLEGDGLFRRAQLLIEFAQQPGDRSDLLARRAAQHFGWMRREHERDLELVEVDGGGRIERLEGSAQRTFAVERAFATPEFPVQLFGQIHHAKIQTERANDVDRVVGREGVEHGVDFVIEPPSGFGAALPREQPQPFDVLVGVRPRMRAQYVADEPAQIRNTRAQRSGRVTLRIAAGRSARGSSNQNHRGTSSR
jgi:hypothetical protein